MCCGVLPYALVALRPNYGAVLILYYRLYSFGPLHHLHPITWRRFALSHPMKLSNPSLCSNESSWPCGAVNSPSGACRDLNGGRRYPSGSAGRSRTGRVKFSFEKISICKSMHCMRTTRRQTTPPFHHGMFGAVTLTSRMFNGGSLIPREWLFYVPSFVDVHITNYLGRAALQVEWAATPQGSCSSEHRTVNQFCWEHIPTTCSLDSLLADVHNNVTHFCWCSCSLIH